MSPPAWILWLGATLLPLGALWLLWQLGLRRERGYHYNRALLLLAPLLATTLPLLPRPGLPAWPGWLAGSEAGAAPTVELLLVTVEPGTPAAGAAAWPGWPWLLGLYLGGVAVGLGWLAWQAGRLWWLARHLPRFGQPGYVLVHTSGRLPSSSFGRVVFWDETAALTATEARVVLAHELAHVRQRHTLDVLWLHLWRAVLWPNPFVHLLLPALRLTHELLADRAAAAETGPATYAPALASLAARQLTRPRLAALLHPFTFSATLTRLAMLKNSTPVRRWKQWLPLPLLVAAGLLVGRPTAAQTTPTPAAPARPAATTAPQSVTSPVFRRGDQVAYKRAWREMRREDSLKNRGVNLSDYTMSFTQDPVPGQPGMVRGTLTYVPKSQGQAPPQGPAGSPPATPTEPRPSKEFLRERWVIMQRKRRLALYQDSLRGPLAPGTMREVQVTRLDGPEEPEVRVVRVPKAGAPPSEDKSGQVYTYVEQMPALPGGGGVQAIVQAIVEAIQKNIVYPANGNMQGKVFVKFTVQADGSVADVEIVKSLADTYDRAVVEAIGRLPRLVPGRQQGRAVAVSFTVPVLFAAKP